VKKILIDGSQFIGELGVQVLNNLRITQHLNFSPASCRAILRFKQAAVETAASIGALKLTFYALRMIPQQLQHSAEALTALSTTAAGGIDVAELLAACGCCRLLQLPVG